MLKAKSKFIMKKKTISEAVLDWTPILQINVDISWDIK